MLEKRYLLKRWGPGFSLDTNGTFSMVDIDFWQFSPFEVHLCVFFQVIPEAWPSRVARFQQSCEFLLICWAVCRVLCTRCLFLFRLCRDHSPRMLSGTKTMCMDSRHSIWSEDRGRFFFSFCHPCRRLWLCVQWWVRTLTLGGSTSMTVWFALRRVLFETILGSESAQVVFLRFGELPESEFSN